MKDLGLVTGTWSECVSAFKQADQIMGSAFHQKLRAIGSARELYIAEHGKEHGFVTRFAEDCGVKQPYMYRINEIEKSKIILASIFSELGADTLYALAKAPEAVVELAQEHIQSGGSLNVKDVRHMVDNHNEGSVAKEVVAREPAVDPRTVRTIPDAPPMNPGNWMATVMTSTRPMFNDRIIKNYDDSAIRAHMEAMITGKADGVVSPASYQAEKLKMLQEGLRRLSSIADTITVGPKRARA